MNIYDLLSGKSDEKIDKEYKQMLYEKDWYPDEGSVIGPFIPGSATSVGANLPAGGTDGQYLAKKTDQPYEAEWRDLPEIPEIPDYLLDITPQDIFNWTNKQEQLLNGVNLKTINGESLLGSGSVNFKTINGETVLGTGNLEIKSSSISVDNIYPVGSIYMSVNATDPNIIFQGTQWERLLDRFLVGAGNQYTNGTIGGSKDAIVVSHSHTVNGSAENNGAHTHTTSGTAASAGAHTHSTSGTAASNGAHEHGLSGTAESTGAHTHTIGGDLDAQYTSSGTKSWSIHKNATGYKQLVGTTNSTGAHTHFVSGTATSAGAHTHSVSGTAASNGAHTHSVTGTAASNGNHTHNVTGTAASTGQSGVDANLPPYLAVYMWVRTA